MLRAEPTTDLQMPSRGRPISIGSYCGGGAVGNSKVGAGEAPLFPQGLGAHLLLAARNLIDCSDRHISRDVLPRLRCPLRNACGARNGCVEAGGAREGLPCRPHR